jgi:hypothetical protein
MELEYLIIFISADCYPILVKHSAGKDHPNLIIWRNRAFLLKTFAEKDSPFPCPIYQEVDSVRFWSEPVDDGWVHTSRITPVVFEEEGESHEWFAMALELIREAGLSPDQLESGG